MMLCASAAVSMYAYNLTLTGMKFPDGVTAANENGVVPDVRSYTAGYTENGWCVDRCGTRPYVALSPTCNLEGEACQNALTLPDITVVAGDVLTFEARSILPGFPEKYAVMITPAGGDAEVLSACEQTPYHWSTQALSLAAYEGKKVSIKFLALTAKGYMLALDKVSVGPVSYAFEAAEGTGRFYGLEDMDADSCVSPLLKVRNIGLPAADGRFVIKVGDKEVSSVEAAQVGNPETGAEFELSMPVPGALNETTAYELWYENGQNAVKIYSGDFFVSYFRRMHYVDEGSGMWCNNCPKGILAVQGLEAEYPEDLAVGVTHINDVLANATMWKNLHWYSVPRMMINHISATNAEDASKMAPYLNVATEFEIKMEPAQLYSDGTLLASFTARCIGEKDNASGRYRIGAIVTQDISGGADFYQSNALVMPKDEQYYYLPSTIRTHLARFDHVIISDGYDAFNGFTNSLPEMLKEGETYKYIHGWRKGDVAISSPEYADFSKAEVIALLIDTEENVVLNAAKCGVELNSGVAPEWDENAGVATLATDVMGPGKVYNLQGIKVADESTGINALPAGLYISGGKLIQVR